MYSLFLWQSSTVIWCISTVLEHNAHHSHPAGQLLPVVMGFVVNKVRQHQLLQDINDRLSFWTAVVTVMNMWLYLFCVTKM